MNIVIDKQNLRILFAHESMSVLCDLVYLEYPDVALGIHSGAVEGDFARYSDLDLKMLYRNTTSEDPKGKTRVQLIHSLMAAISCLPQVKVNPMELRMQCHAISEREKGRFIYTPGANRPQMMNKLFERPFVTVKRGENEGFMVATQRLYAGVTLPTPVEREALQPSAPAQVPAQATAASTAKVAGESGDTQNGIKRPKPGSLCGSLWDTFDAVLSMNPNLTIKNVQTEEGVQGVNPSTLRTQFNHWRKYNGR